MKRLNPAHYISLEPWLYHDKYFHEVMRGKYGVRDTGCGCCSREEVLSKEEVYQLIVDMLFYLEQEKEKYK